MTTSRQYLAQFRAYSGLLEQGVDQPGALVLGAVAHERLNLLGRGRPARSGRSRSGGRTRRRWSASPARPWGCSWQDARQSGGRARPRSGLAVVTDRAGRSGTGIFVRPAPPAFSPGWAWSRAPLACGLCFSEGEPALVAGEPALPASGFAGCSTGACSDGSNDMARELLATTKPTQKAAVSPQAAPPQTLPGQSIARPPVDHARSPFNSNLVRDGDLVPGGVPDPTAALRFITSIGDDRSVKGSLAPSRGIDLSVALNHECTRRFRGP